MLRKSILAIALILMGVCIINAQVPQLINYQGVLSDAASKPINGSHSIQFSIYNSATGGTAIWTETQTVVVTDGLFNVLLGSVTLIPYTVFDGSDKFLSLKVGADPEMAPRKRLVSVGYSFRAYDADKVDGKDAAAFVQKMDGVSPASDGNIDLVAGANVTITPDIPNHKITISGGVVSGDNLGNHTATQNIKLNGNWLSGDGGNEGIFVNNLGNVGIGTKTQETFLEISGAPANLRGQLKITDPAGDDPFISFYAGTAYKSAIGYSNGVARWSTNDASNLCISGGNVGIDTQQPGVKLQVNGGIRARGGAPGAYGVNNNGYAFTGNNGDDDSGMFSSADGQLEFYTNNAERMRIISSGNVGIGTTDATGAKLKVIQNGTDKIAYFQIDNASNPSNALMVSSNGSGSVIWSGSYGTGAAGYFGIGNSSNNSPALRAVGNAYGGSFTAQGNTGIGVYAETSADFGYGIDVVSKAPNLGIAGHFSCGKGTGVYASGGLWAGFFDGRVNITGNLYKGGGAFMIDHPLEPTTKYLSHSFVESPDMMNIYNGNIMLDANGEAWVTLPDWFEALNKDFRYQLTCIGGFAPLYVDQEVSNNRFKIAGGKAGMKISWQVTGIRHDPFAEANRIEVETTKKAEEQGKYIHPKEYGMPETMGIEYQKKQELPPPAIEEMQSLEEKNR